MATSPPEKPAAQAALPLHPDMTHTRVGLDLLTGTFRAQREEFIRAR